MGQLLVLAQVVAAGAGGALLWLAYRTVARHDDPAARSFGGLLSVLGVTALCAGATAHGGTAYKLVWLATSLAIPLAFALFAFDYYGITLLDTRTRVWGAIVPAVGGVLGGSLVVLGTAAMSPGARAPVAWLSTLPGIVVDLATTLNQIGLYYTTALMVLAIGLVLRTVYRYEHLDARLGYALAFVGVWPWLANLLVPQVAPTLSLGVGVGLVAGGYTASVVLAAVAVGPLGLFDSSPMAGNVGPEVVLDSMDDAVVVVDDNETVLRMNRVARETFGSTAAEAAGGPLASLVDSSLDALLGSEPVAIETTDGIRQFSVARSTVTDRTGADRGHVLVLHDVTRRRTREQRLAVFNRVLRHNLRNEANNIIGRAQLISDGGDPDPWADQIVETTTDLVGVADRAREIDRVITAPDGEGHAAVGEVVESVAAAVGADNPSVEITTAVPGGLVAAVDASVLEIVLRNLVENAAEHNDADEPIVTVSANEDGTWLAVTVADNGPGIPELERSALERGTEDPLHHASGLGLWAVSWGVTRMGGSVTFSENEPRGSAVTVTLPAASERPATAPEDGSEPGRREPLSEGGG